MLRLTALRLSNGPALLNLAPTSDFAMGGEPILRYGLVLPQNKNYTVSFSFGGREETGTFSSFLGEATCVTTIQLK